MSVRIEREVEQSTGIFTKVKGRYVSENPWEAFLAFVEDWNNEIWHWLDTIEEGARAVIDGSATLPKRMDDTGRVQKALLTDLRDLIQHCKRMRRDAGEDDTADLYWAYWIGQMVMRCQVRHVEYNALVGRNLRVQEARRHVKAWGTPADKKRRYAAYQRYVDIAHQQDPKRSYEKICGNAAKHFGKHINTIKTHTVRWRD